MIRSSKTASTRQIHATSSLTALTASKNCSDTTAMLTTANSTQLATNHSLSRKMLLTKCPPEKTNPPINGLLMCCLSFSPHHFLSQIRKSASSTDLLPCSAVLYTSCSAFLFHFATLCCCKVNNPPCISVRLVFPIFHRG